MQSKSILNIMGLEDLAYWPLGVVFGLGFFSGFPLLLTSSTLQAWGADRGLSLVEIGALSWLGLPYLLKWAWAPLLDYYRFSQTHTGRHIWMMMAQVIIVIGLLSIALSSTHLMVWKISALIVVLASATQDLAIDAYRVELLSEREYGLGSALNMMGYRLAMMLSGGVLWVIADQVGWRWAYELSAGVMLFGLVWVALSPRTPWQRSVQAESVSLWRTAWSGLCRHDQIVAWLCLIVVYRLADAVVANLGGVFLLKHCQLSLSVVGVLYKVVGIVATILGALIGGIWLRKVNVKQVLWTGSVLQALSCLPYIGLAFWGTAVSLWAVSLTVAAECFCSGIATTALMVVLMRWCDKEHIMTQFAWLSALVAIPRVLLGPLVGQAAETFGWVGLWSGATVCALLSMLLLWGPLRGVKTPTHRAAQ